MARVPRPSDPEAGAFWRHLEAVLPVDGDALDVGTGTGRVALAIAPRARSVLGVDVDGGALEAARWDADRRGFANARFVSADAQATDLRALHGGRGFALVTARLFLSLPLLPRVAQALEPGGRFILEALEAEHWHEAGGSRFNLASGAVLEELARLGLKAREACVEVHRVPLPDARAAQQHLKDHRLWARWRADGRWATLRESLRHGEGGLTEAHLVVGAERPSV